MNRPLILQVYKLFFFGFRYCCCDDQIGIMLDGVEFGKNSLFIVHQDFIRPYLLNRDC